MSTKQSRKPHVPAATVTHVGRIKTPLTYSATAISQTNFTLYMFKAKASDLFQSLSINRRIADKNEGYQRVLSSSRVEAIKQYIKQNRPIPGAIIVSLDKATFGRGRLTIPSGTDVGWVIDGQHRLAGAAMAAQDGTDVELPVVAFIGLDLKRQIDQFITINREGKNVPTSLYLDLLQYLPHKKPGDIAKDARLILRRSCARTKSHPFSSASWLRRRRSQAEPSRW